MPKQHKQFIAVQFPSTVTDDGNKNRYEIASMIYMSQLVGPTVRIYMDALVVSHDYFIEMNHEGILQPLCTIYSFLISVRHGPVCIQSLLSIQPVITHRANVQTQVFFQVVLGCFHIDMSTWPAKMNVDISFLLLLDTRTFCIYFNRGPPKAYPLVIHSKLERTTKMMVPY